MHSILIIADEPDLAAVTARALRQTLGAEVSVSTTVADALSRLASGEPDAVILDLALDTNPEPLHVALRTRGIPTLLVSREHPEQLEQVASLGNWEYLASPYNQSALMRTVRGLLGLEAAISGGFAPVGTRDQSGAYQLPSGLSQPPSAVSQSGAIKSPFAQPSAPTPEPVQAPTVAVAAVAQPGSTATVNVATPPPSIPASVQIVDKLGEIAAVLVIGFLCLRGRVEGVDALVAIGAVLGIQVVPRALSAARGAGAAVGVVGMVLLAALGGLTPAAATELEPLTPQTSGQHRALRGFATVTTLSIVTLAAAASIAVFAALR